jgi:hypothetical protein
VQVEQDQEAQEKAQVGIVEAPRLLLEIKDGPHSDQQDENRGQDIRVFHLNHLQVWRLSIYQDCSKKQYFLQRRSGIRMIFANHAILS